MTVLGAAIVAAGSFFYLSSNPTNLEQKNIGSILTEMGVLYYNGNSEIHVKKDVNAAIGFFNKAVKFNDPVAIYNMGVLYRDGVGVENDNAKARDLFKQAAELGYPDAQSEYGRLLYFKEKNIKEGVEWLKKASENGSQSARFFLACIYFDGDENIKPDQDYAVSEMKKLADSGYQPAADLLKQLEEGDASETPNSADESAPVENDEQEEDPF